MRKRVYSFLFLFLILFSLASCDGNNKSTFDISSSVSEKFPFKYGKVYSDEFEKDDEFYFGDDLKKIIFGDNFDKFTYIESVSGYFSRDMVSGSEFIAVRLTDRSHRAEITACFYRRAALKTDMETRVICEGNFVFFICDRYAENISKYAVSLV